MSPGLQEKLSLCGTETEKALPATKSTSPLSKEGLTGGSNMRSKLIVGNSENTTNSGRISMSELWTHGLEPLWTLATCLMLYKKLKQLSLQ